MKIATKTVQNGHGSRPYRLTLDPNLTRHIFFIHQFNELTTGLSIGSGRDGSIGSLPVGETRIDRPYRHDPLDPQALGASEVVGFESLAHDPRSTFWPTPRTTSAPTRSSPTSPPGTDRSRSSSPSSSWSSSSQPSIDHAILDHVIDGDVDVVLVIDTIVKCAIDRRTWLVTRSSFTLRSIVLFATSRLDGQIARDDNGSTARCLHTLHARTRFSPTTDEHDGRGASPPARVRGPKRNPDRDRPVGVAPTGLLNTWPTSVGCPPPVPAGEQGRRADYTLAPVAPSRSHPGRLGVAGLPTPPTRLRAAQPQQIEVISACR